MQDFINAKDFDHIYKYFIQFLRDKNTGNLVVFDSSVDKLDPTELYDRFIDVALVGTIKLSNIEEIPIYFIKTKELSERTSRKQQFELGKELIRNEHRYIAGIFIFYDENGNKRISHIEKIYTDGKAVYNNFRRYTFFISLDQTNKTFIKQFASGDFIQKETIKEVFSVEKVTKQFYQEISNWYFWSLKHVRFPADAENEKNGREIGIIRFITRIIFIWFMREKGLVPKSLFDQSKLKSILKTLDDNESTYYRAILQNLFFATLNTPISERKFRKEESFHGVNRHYMNHTYFRFHDDFENPDDMLDLFGNIPFLNSGLFECLDKGADDPDNHTGKEIRIDGFSDIKSKQVTFPNFLFFSDEKTVDLSEFFSDQKDKKKYKNAKVRGLINTLSSYKFTIDENTLNDEEIALDPELLGNIFENLLAAYNPETATSARKATGSYYTPRVIVDYMVTESLKEYFISKFEENFGYYEIESFKKNLENLFDPHDDNKPFDEEIIDFLIQKINEIKIIDPAVGSGAFPMGILHKLVFLLSKLDLHNEKWKQEQISAVEKVTDPKLREELKRKIEENFNNNELDYGRKLYLIQNCIYGVDIQPIAIQIAKLRFFISLLVDEKSNDKKEENFGIEPLPNLETKLVAANTLIALPQEPYTCPKIGEIRQLEKQLFQVKNRYFTANTQGEKKKIQKEDREIRQEIKNMIEAYVRENKTELEQLYKQLESLPVKYEYVQENAFLDTKIVKKDINQAERDLVKKKIEDLERKIKQDEILLEKYRKIAEFNIFDSNTSADWFDPEWMFGVKNEFDIVIGNPPYIQLQKAFDKNADLYKDQQFETFDRKGDLYFLFYEKGIELLKMNGILTYITSNKWMRTGYGEKLRSFFVKYNPKILIDLGPNVFENATVDTNILIIQKSLNQRETKAVSIKSDKKCNVNLGEEVRENSFVLSNLGRDAWFVGSNLEQRLKEKIERIGKPLKDWDVKIYYGIKTGLNEAFIIDSKKREEILANCKDEEERKRTEAIIKPILRGRDIKRYYYEWAELWVIWSYQGININEFPSLKNYLMQFKTELERRTGGARKLPNGELFIPYQWYELQVDSKAHIDEFEKEKVVWQRITQEPTFCIVEPNIFILDSMSFFTGENLKYILAILNSKLIYYYVKTIVHQYGYTGFRLSNQYVEIMPLPTVTSTNQITVNQIEQVVDQISAIKRKDKNADISHLEKEIDQLVYKLYDLTEEEIRLVEGKG